MRSMICVAIFNLELFLSILNKGKIFLIYRTSDAALATFSLIILVIKFKLNECQN